MKITCPYCGNLFNDTLEKCPSCGAPNAGVVRRSGEQPITIEELRQWYASKGLPPYEVTRFFIGEDYQGPRAFGIYQEEQTGEFVVYKNKDNGTRAVRYRGTDEAYAVNELYQRLKQEIIQQKRANVERQVGRTPANYREAPKRKKKVSQGCLITLITMLVPVFIFLTAIIVVIIEDAPKDGYYDYAETVYYYYEHNEPNDYTDWFWYDAERNDWLGPVVDEDLPERLEKNKKAKAYYLSEDKPSSFSGPSFLSSDVYLDASRAYTVSTGYYQYNDRTYYHLLDDFDSGWYYYDYAYNTWYESTEIPDDLQRNSSAEDFYYTPTWDSSTQITDFTDTTIYQDYLDDLYSESSDSSDWDDDDDDDYDWDSGDSWDSGGTDWDSDW